ncbi:hydroxymethylbilane synthase [Baekduia soli]|uniref:Hydroxymethylbilane synthase n=1 Tax=Baekduia soli TaxID=496014 RepID=A0A5B8U1K0_9ACTN|nr:hydroxymethylbilane synthase [Baekduia soli]QEC46695.1 hydroxymethylbilane synthase [Baekduia soli]
MRLGTRGSALARVQADAVAGALGGAEIVEITTSGDRGVAGDKARWIDTIEDALERGDIDLAVHSAKDVPAASLLRPGMAVAAVLPREDARDALVGAAALDDVPEGARVGTASLRRRAQLLAVRPDLEIVDLRGNVDTRLRRLAEGACDALVLAAAGLRRLGRGDEIGVLLDPAVFVPAPGQGALALEGRAIPEGIVDAPADTALGLERAVVEALGATCDTPVGCHYDGTALHAFVGLPDGSEWLRDAVTGPDPAAALVARLRTMGADDLLARAGELA